MPMSAYVKALIEQGDNTAQDADRRIQYYFLGGLTKEEIAQRLADTLSEADQKSRRRAKQ